MSRSAIEEALVFWSWLSNSLGRSLWGSCSVSFLAAGLGLCLEGGAARADEPEAPWIAQCPHGTTLRGIDVSSWQGEMDWSAVQGEDVAFAYLRVSDGASAPDPMFARNWEEARRTGVPRGAYQFFRPAEDPEEQADLLLEMMGPLQKGDLPPVLDVEVAGDLAPVDVVLRIDRWIARVRRATSVRPVIYASAINWALLTENSARFKRLGLWVAHHEVDCPNTPRPWTHWTFHQRSAAMRLTGISTVVDEDLFLGGSRALRRLRVQDEAAARRAWRHWMKKRQRAQTEAEANADANP